MHVFLQTPKYDNLIHKDFVYFVYNIKPVASLLHNIKTYP